MTTGEPEGCALDACGFPDACGLPAAAGEAAVADARQNTTEADRALVGRFLNRELDLR